MGASGLMLSLWRRFMAWLNADDIASLLRSAEAIDVEQSKLLAAYRKAAASDHCPTCAASRIPDPLRTDYERALIAKEWTAHYKGPARG